MANLAAGREDAHVPLSDPHDVNSDPSPTSIQGAESPLRHPLHAARDEIADLVDVAERGESPATPAVVIGGIGLVLIPLVATIITFAFAVGYLSTRGSTGPATPPTASSSALCGEQRAASSGGAHACRTSNRAVGGSSPRFNRATVRPIDVEALMEMFWTVVAYTVLSGVFVVLPFLLLALLWRAAGRQRTA